MTEPEFSLEGYMMWFLGVPIGALQPPVGAITDYGDIVATVLHRQPPFQVELITLPKAGVSFEGHRHPNIDQFEVYLAGDMELVVSGVKVSTSDGPSDAGRGTRIGPNDIHSGRSGSGASWLSIQMWLNGVEPTSVGLDWEGPTSSDEQRALQAAHKAAV